MDYVSPTSCSTPFLLLLGTGQYFCLFLSFFLSLLVCFGFFFNVSSDGSVRLAVLNELKQEPSTIFLLLLLSSTLWFPKQLCWREREVTF